MARRKARALAMIGRDAIERFDAVSVDESRTGIGPPDSAMRTSRCASSLSVIITPSTRRLRKARNSETSTSGRLVVLAEKQGVSGLAQHRLGLLDEQRKARDVEIANGAGHEPRPARAHALRRDVDLIAEISHGLFFRHARAAPGSPWDDH